MGMADCCPAGAGFGAPPQWVMWRFLCVGVGPGMEWIEIINGRLPLTGQHA